MNRECIGIGTQLHTHKTVYYIQLNSILTAELICSVQTGREATHMIFPVNVSTVQTQVTDVKRKLRSSTVGSAFYMGSDFHKAFRYARVKFI